MNKIYECILTFLKDLFENINMVLPEWFDNKYINYSEYEEMNWASTHLCAKNNVHKNFQ